MIFLFIPTWGNDPIWLIFFQMGWNHQLGYKWGEITVFFSELLTPVFWPFIVGVIKTPFITRCPPCTQLSRDSNKLYFRIPIIPARSNQYFMECHTAKGFGRPVVVFFNMPILAEALKWVFPKIVGFPPKSSILIGFSIIFTIHFGGKSPYFWKHPNEISGVTKLTDRLTWHFCSPSKFAMVAGRG